MSTVQNNFDGGTNGVTITTGNSGGASGDAFANVTGPFVYDTTGARAGEGGRVQIASSTAWRSYHSWSAVSQLAARIVFTLNGSVSNTFTIASSVDTAFAANFKFGINGSSKLVVQNAAGSTLATSAAALSANTAYVAEYQVAPGVDTSSGTIQLQLYTVAAPGTLLLNYASSTVNAGTNQLIRGQLGHNDTVTSLDITFDDIKYNLSTLTPVGPPGANSAPTANAGVDQTNIEPWVTVTLDGTGSSDPDLGDTITYAWSQTGGTSVTLSDPTAAQPTFTAPGTIAGDTLTFSLVVTDNHGASSSADTMTVAVLYVTERAVIGGVEVTVHTQVVKSGSLQ
jgi:hypothetical protein